MLVYADGSCLRNPGPGTGASISIDKVNKNLHIHVGKVTPMTTSSYMELSALMSVILNHDKSSEVNFFTDSQYVVNSYNLWLENGINKTNFKGISYSEEGRMIYKCKGSNFKVNGVKGHNKVAYNELAHGLAFNKVVGNRDIA